MSQKAATFTLVAVSTSDLTKLFIMPVNIDVFTATSVSPLDHAWSTGCKLPATHLEAPIRLVKFN